MTLHSAQPGMSRFALSRKAKTRVSQRVVKTAHRLLRTLIPEVRLFMGPSAHGEHLHTHTTQTPRFLPYPTRNNARGPTGMRLYLSVVIVNYISTGLEVLGK
jgi:hypothetical protein